MEYNEPLLSTLINPNNFPAKLWRLVNDPRYRSICWNARGDSIIIDQQLFESEVLSPVTELNEANEWFKTTNFTSFIRQLNLYGFRKFEPRSGGNVGLHYPDLDLRIGDGSSHQFHNQYFQKERPDLLVNLKRLTTTNKTKMAEGLEVKSRPPSRFQKSLTGSLTEEDKERCQGLMPQQFTSSHNFPYPYIGPPPHSQEVFTGMQLAYPPLHPGTWPMCFHQTAQTTYTYTSTSVPVQQGHCHMPIYSSYLPHHRHLLPEYHPANIPGYTTLSPVHFSSRSSSEESINPYTIYQNSPLQSSSPKEPIDISWSSHESAEDEMNLQSASGFADERQSSPVDMVNLGTVESLMEPAAPLLQNENATSANQTETLLSSGWFNSMNCFDRNVKAVQRLAANAADLLQAATDASSDETLCADDEASPSWNEYNDITDLNLLAEEACKSEELPQTKE